MRKLAPFLLIFVVACAGAQTPAQKLFVAQSNLNGALAVTRAYVTQPECTAVVVTGCADPAIKAQLKTLAKEAGDALQTAKAGRGVTTANDMASRITAAGAAATKLVTYLVSKGLIK